MYAPKGAVIALSVLVIVTEREFLDSKELVGARRK